MTGGNRTRIALALLLLLIAAAGLLWWTDAHRLATANAWVLHTQEVSRQIELLAGDLISLESSARGYVLSGDARLTAEARESEQSARTGAQDLARLTADNPRQQELGSQLTMAVGAKIAFNETVLRTRDAQGPAAATALVATGSGIDRMDRVQSILDQMRAEEQRLLRERTESLNRIRQRGFVLGGVLIGLLFVTLVAFVAMARGEHLARRRAAEATRLSEERFRLLLGAVRDYAIIMLDPKGNVESWIGAAERIFGYTAAEIAGEHVSRFLPADLAADAELVSAEQKGRFEEEALRIRKSGETFWADVVVTAIRDDEGRLRGFAKVVRDITERKKLDDALRESRAQLAQSNRELQDFAMVASHDLQEPLRKVQMFGDKLRRRYADQLGDEGRDWLTRMMNAAARGQSLILGLLAFSRVTTRAQPKIRVDLGQTAREVVGDLEARILDVGGRVEIGPLPTVEADPLQMRQLLQNLIGNALKFRKPDEPPVVRVQAEGTNGLVHLSVSDNGIGFDPKYVDRIFKLFQRLHERGTYEGSGMGLAICRKIVERHGGHITAHNEPGRGTTFLIDLPAQQ